MIRRRPGARRLGALRAAAGVAVVTAGCSAQSGDSFVLHYTTYSGPTSDQSKTVQRWAEDVEERTGGAVTVRFHYSESLVGADESAQATLDGRADMAQVGSLYSVSDLPMYTAVELPFETDDPRVQMTAIERLYEETPEFREDFDSQGIRLLYPLPLGISVLGTKQPVETLEDLRGMSVRSGGLTSEALLSVGVNPVAMTATDVYESMERGIVDGYTSLGLSNLPTFGLADTTPYILDNGIGSYASSIVVINEELFQSMPGDIQEAVLAASEDAVDIGLEELDALGDAACTELRDAGAAFGAFDADEVERWRDEAAIAEGWVARNAERGYDAQAVLDDYRRFVAEGTETSTYQDPLVACAEGAGS